MKLYALIPVLVFSSLLGACSTDDSSVAIRAVFHSDPTQLVPFPSNRYTAPAETMTGIRPDVAAFVTTADTALYLYRDLAAELSTLDGFGTSAPIVIRFTGPIEVTTLPGNGYDKQAQINASTQTDCSVCLQDANTSEKIPFFWRYAHDRNQLLLFPATALQPRTDYVYYVTDRLTDKSGHPLRADADFAMLREQGKSDLLPQTHAASLYKDVQRIAGPITQTVILADRFTTQSIVDETLALQERVFDTYDATIHSVVDTGRASEYAHVGAIYEAQWTAWDFRDSNNRLDPTTSTPSRTKKFPFYIGIPAAGTQPYPVILVQHGLGDSREVFFRVVDQFTAKGFAIVAIDVPEHGERVPEAEDVKGILGRFRDSLGFWADAEHFDFQLHRIRDVFRQAVVDHAQIRTALRNTAAADLDFDGDGDTDLDLETWFYYGQSMGAIIGTATVALAPDIRTATLNVGGARLTGFAYHFPALEGIRAGMEAHFGSWADATRIVSIMQIIMERGDPFNYAHLLQQQPLYDGLERDILMQFALDDGTVPNPMNWELAQQAQLPLVLPAPVVPELQETTLSVPQGLRANLQGRTGGYVIYDEITTRDGDKATATHGNMFSSMEATRQAACLFLSSRTDQPGTIIAPGKDC